VVSVRKSRQIGRDFNHWMYDIGETEVDEIDLKLGCVGCLSVSGGFDGRTQRLMVKCTGDAATVLGSTFQPASLGSH